MFYPVFAAMEQHNMILNLHGEVPSLSASTGTDGVDITVLNAEEAFLPKLRDLHARFPKVDDYSYQGCSIKLFLSIQGNPKKLRIVLEHCTTRAALEAVTACGNTVAGTITVR